MAAEPCSPKRGATTLAALSLTTALGVAVGSYLALFTQSQRLDLRQFQGERAAQLAETGLEEALWALNQNNWNNAGPASNTPWTLSGTTRSVTLDYGALGQGATGQVAVTVSNCTSTGPVWPTVTVTATVTHGGGQIVSKALEATTAPAPLFGNAIASAEAGVSFEAGGIVDSWNSDPDDNPATSAVDYSFTAGNPANHAAVVAGRDDGTHGVVLTQATVRGYVATFGQPVGFSVSGAPPGRVLGPATTASVNMDPTRIGRSAFVPVAPVFSVTPPPTSGPAYGGLLGTVLALVNALLGAPPEVEVYRVNGDLTILGIPLLSPSLTVNRRLKLIVDGNLTISGAGKITVTTAGSLELFVAGDCTIGGAGIDNQNVEPAKFALYATSASTSDTLVYNTTAPFRGVIYAENKPIDIRQNATLHGALLSRRQIRFTAGATAPVFHYDTALRTTRFPGIRTPYVISKLSQP